MRSSMATRRGSKGIGKRSPPIGLLPPGFEQARAGRGRQPDQTASRGGHARQPRGDRVLDATCRSPQQRFFSVFDVPSARVRGEHAHRVCHQVLVCLRGSVSVVVDDGAERDEVRLDDPAVALHIPPLVWASQYRFSRDAILGVFASHPYDAGDYIRDYEDYLVLKAATLDTA